MLYSASGGFLTILFGLLGAAAAEAAPDKPAPNKVSPNSGIRAAETRTGTPKLDDGKAEDSPGKKVKSEQEKRNKVSPNSGMRAAETRTGTPKLDDGKADDSPGKKVKSEQEKRNKVSPNSGMRAAETRTGTPKLDDGKADDSPGKKVKSEQEKRNKVSPNSGIRAAGAERERLGPPVPVPPGGDERTLAERIAEDGLGVQPRNDDLLDRYGRLRDRTPPPPSDAMTVTSTAPPLSEEQRAGQEREQTRSRLRYANPDSVPPGPPSPPTPSAAAAADAQRQRERQMEADGHAGYRTPATTPEQANKLREALEQRRQAEQQPSVPNSPGAGERERLGPPMPEPPGQDGRTLAERIAEDGLGVQPREDELLDSYGRLRGQAAPPASDATTVTSTAPPPTEEQRARQEREQAASRLRYANPDSVPPGPPSPPTPSVAAAADAQRQRERQMEADGHAGYRTPATTPEQIKSLGRAVEERRKADEQERANKPEGSIGVCIGGGGSLFGVAGGGADSCVVADTQGLGWSGTGYYGGTNPTPNSPKVGFSRSLIFKGSQANIDELAGPSVYGGASLFRGVGLEGGVSVTDDGKHISDSLGVGVGLDASAGPRREDTDSGRWFDWADLFPTPETTALAPGDPTTTEH
ncbi:hypothetical protein [Amycolatopsis magusensis]|uniref:Uncharacterized protein n=1 Tax=Amycolatopsis magusensis TaxID=882444 RepID=A0ABS4PWL3_9PSEU|nr:hypothetical protein [Amycolatopsis magusensis]MBP2183805.1 hypothetical protein [Amycolatopsis magusensis]